MLSMTAKDQRKWLLILLLFTWSYTTKSYIIPVLSGFLFYWLILCLTEELNKSFRHLTIELKAGLHNLSPAVFWSAEIIC